MNTTNDPPGQRTMKPGTVFNPNGHFTFAPVPNVILRNPDLSFREKCIYGRLAQFTGANGKCYPSVELLAEELGTSARNVRFGIDQLVSKKYLKKITPSLKSRRRHRKTTHYLFIWHSSFNQVTDSSHEGQRNEQQSGYRSRETDNQGKNPSSDEIRGESGENQGSIRGRILPLKSGEHQGKNSSP